MSDPSTWDDPRITAYVIGELSGDELAAFEREIQSNAELQSAVDEARHVTDKLADLFDAESTPPLTDDRLSAINAGSVASVRTGPPPIHPGTQPGHSGNRSWKIPMLMLATAAVVALMVGVAPMLKPDAEVAYDINPTSSITESTESDSLGPIAESTNERPPEPASTAFSFQRNDALQTTPQLASTAPNQAPAPENETRSRRSRRAGGMDMAMDLEGVMDMDTSGMEMDDMMMGMGGMDMGGVDMGGMGMGGMGMDGGMMGGMPAPTPPAAPNSVQLQSSTVAGDDIQADVAAPFAPEPTLSKPLLAMNRQRLEKSQSMGTVPGGPQPPAIVVVPTNKDLFFDELQTEISIRGKARQTTLGRGPQASGDKFEPITDNPFKRVDEHPLSTFSVDVDTASYSKTRDHLMRANQLPQPDAVRIEELINYFDYAYQPPAADAEHPFASAVDISSCPWNPEHRLARIAIQGKTMQKKQRPACNLVFLIDTSGSMNSSNKLPLVINGMKMLAKQLGPKDRIAIAVYAGSAGLVLDSTPAKKAKKISKALTQLSAGGSTNGGAGIQLAYQTARENFITDGVNRVILCSDGDFNVGTTSTSDLVRLVETEAKGGVFLTVLGFGMGNHNDSMLEQISGRGNGNYAFIDSQQEARKVLVDQISGTLVTIAKDVKLQVEFNPTQVSSYRLIGYENRVLAKEDFNDDKKDAGEIGAGHSVTALYELVPAGKETDAAAPKVDDLKYQVKSKPAPAADSDETLTLKLRYKQPDGDTSTLVEFPVVDDGKQFDDADIDTRFAAAVAGFGMQLRRSPYVGSWAIDDVLAAAKSSQGEDENGLRTEFIQMVRKASQLMGNQ
ncbi:von Willebrand factor [Rubripirellula lacrimiformis]|uniref:von Willebrand factor n=1 Tax=Rubripirellula lacrimiformis TaxID=1930273 RepID=A0A517N8Z8_9BACT|nr:von Willebrand factor type A domain-containing protein [Rubripirellula lacrimiformis]QDT03609.1 von Willebrand factor [Rubripirellula lacrimiformis]